MKKTFVYLITVLMFGAMLLGCGADKNGGVIGASPKPTHTVDIIPTEIPETETSIMPEVETSTTPGLESHSPQVGARTGVSGSSKATDSSYN